MPPLFNSPISSFLPRLPLSSSHRSVEGPSDIWLSPASRGSRRCRRFWQAGTGTPRGPDGGLLDQEEKERTHHKMHPQSETHSHARGANNRADTHPWIGQSNAPNEGTADGECEKAGPHGKVWRTVNKLGFKSPNLTGWPHSQSCLLPL